MSAGLSPRKGQLYLLKAWEKLKLPSAELLLIGRVSPEMKPILEPYRHLFRHIAHVPNHELRKFYTSCDLFVLPTIEDGCSYVCLESMACGLPVITTTNNGAGELVQDGVSGYVVPIRAVDTLAERIETLYRDRELLRSMGKAGVANVRQNLNWERYAHELIAFYDRIYAARETAR